MELSSGQNTAINSRKLKVHLAYVRSASFGKSDIDPSAFLLDKNDRVRGDGDFIFYNQPQSVDGGVVFSAEGDGAYFEIDLDKISNEIDKVAFTLVIDGVDTFGGLSQVKLDVKNECVFSVPVENRSEKALIVGQLYRHSGGWKFRAQGQGFNGGIAPLARGFGVDVDEPEPLSSAPFTPATQKPTVSLEKKLEQQAPHLVSLAKPIMVSLEKHRLEKTRAKVAFVLDASGSMHRQFKLGNVQSVLDRIAALALQFDDDGSMDLWGFATHYKKYPDVTMANLKDYIVTIQNGDRGFMESSILPRLGGSNNEPPVMEEIIDTFKDSKEPAFVVFITDGGISQSKAIKKAIKRSANHPIFWKFVGLGGSNYGVLNELDDFTDRTVDNSDFFPIDDFKKVSDSELYDRLLSEFGAWLQMAKSKKILA